MNEQGERATGGRLQPISGLIDLNKYEAARQRAAERADAEGPLKGPARHDCAECGGAGWLKYDAPSGEYGVSPWRYSLVQCPCRAGASADRRQQRLNRWSTLENDHRGETFDRATDYKGQRLALDRARIWTAEPVGWFVLLGEPGTGKSYIAACAGWELYHQGRGVLWMALPDFVRHLRATYREVSAMTTSEQMEVIMDAPYLFLDDVGSETGKDDVRDAIWMLIERRHKRVLPTVVTTNRTLDDLGGRIADRLSAKGQSTMAYVGGGSKRVGDDREASGMSAYHYLNDRPHLCGECGGRPCLLSCAAQTYPE